MFIFVRFDENNIKRLNLIKIKIENRILILMVIKNLNLKVLSLKICV